jgi:hypothetical protein
MLEIIKALGAVEITSSVRDTGSGDWQDEIDPLHDLTFPPNNNL